MSNPKSDWPLWVCPVCALKIMWAEMGISSHVRAHVRRGEMSPAESLAARKAAISRARKAVTA